MSWKAEYIILIMISTLIDYIAGIQIFQSKTKERKNFFLRLSLISNLGLLFAFKYFNFFSDSVRLLLQQFSIQLNPITLKVLLPVGISFYTFQSMCYTIDIYRNRIKPQRHLGIFAVYISFFPQLVAGPIERAKNLMPQFLEKHYFDYTRVTNGLKLMLWGFFKKVVIADRLSIIVDTIYNDPTNYTGIPLILATFFFVFQIYCDFSGYTDIAIGSAQVMGFTLMDNFKRPFYSKNPSEFWRRWHISLSTWFRDYVFNPFYFYFQKHKSLNNLSLKNRHLLSFGLSLLFGESLLGLWHGANWTYILFGLYHGLLIFIYYLIRKLWDKMHRFIQIGITFILVSLSFIIFRASSVQEAFYVFIHLFSGISFGFYGINIGVGWWELLLCFLVIAFMEMIHFIQEHRSIRQFLSQKPLLLRWTIYILLLWMILFLGVFTKQQFIYFQF